MIQFLVGLGAGIVVGLLMEWLIDWNSFSVRGRDVSSSPAVTSGDGAARRSASAQRSESAPHEPDEPGS